MARILVCDDSLFIRKMMSTLLIAGGHEVVAEGCDGKQAVALYREHKPDVVTMDITMPDMNGLEAMQTIMAEDPSAQILMVTAIGQSALINEAIQSGAADFIVKPFQEQGVLDAINRILNHG